MNAYQVLLSIYNQHEVIEIDPHCRLIAVRRLDGGAEISRVDNAGVDKWARRRRGGHRERVDNVARRSKDGQRGSGQGGTKKHGWLSLIHI